jgi:hypothetical protein
VVVVVVVQQISIAMPATPALAIPPEAPAILPRSTLTEPVRVCSHDGPGESDGVADWPRRAARTREAVGTSKRQARTCGVPGAQDEDLVGAATV